MSEPAWVPLGAQPPGGKELAYVERTTPLAITATTEATSQVFITAPPIVCDGQPIEIEFYTPTMDGTQYAYLSLWDGETNIGGIANLSAAGGQEAAPVLVRRKLVPTPGTHTYSIRATRGTGSGNVYGGPGVGGYMPAYLRITQRDVVPNVVPAGAPPLVTGLPASPVDGQEVILCDSLTAPTYTWHLRYIAAKASNKWVFVGGSPAIATILGGDTTASGSFVDLASVGPSITAPVAGSYRFDLFFQGANNTAALFTVAALKVGAAATSDDNGALNTSPSANNPVTASKVGGVITAAAGDVLKMQYRVSGGTGTFLRRTLVVTPIALGG